LAVAAFIWMLLVAAGLVLIVLRIVSYRSDAWLSRPTRRCWRSRFSYVVSLGPHAIPALDRSIASQPKQDLRQFRHHRDALAAAHLDSWRTGGPGRFAAGD
jgi:hypothetical protein